MGPKNAAIFFMSEGHNSQMVNFCEFLWKFQAESFNLTMHMKWWDTRKWQTFIVNHYIELCIRLIWTNNIELCLPWLLWIALYKISKQWRIYGLYLPCESIATSFLWFQLLVWSRKGVSPKKKHSGQQTSYHRHSYIKTYRSFIKLLKRITVFIY